MNNAVRKPKAVILDGYAENPGDLSWDTISEVCDLTVYPRTEPALISERIGDAEIVITNKTPIRKETLDQCHNLKFITVLATGFDVIDINEARDRNIIVSNVPAYGTETVSQYAVALLLEVCHNIGAHSRSVHEGKWQTSIDWCFWESPLIELSEKTAGIIGLGRIGKKTAQILFSMGMSVLGYDPYVGSVDNSNVKIVDLAELLAQSDVILLHCPLTPDNVKLVNETTISQMRDGVIIINNSRGALIDERALADALDSGKVSAAAVDVVSKEPISDDNPLLHAKNCLITPHISWATREARQRIMNTTKDNIDAFLADAPINVVNT